MKAKEGPNGFLHPCEVIYELSDKPIYGEVHGVCRIIGKESRGIPFEQWVGENFTDFGYLYPGDIISNAAYFCFTDQNDFLRRKLGRTEITRFRNYSHFVVNGEWYALTKAEKEKMNELLHSNPLIAVISDSGQKHLLFKYRYGYWQFENHFIPKNIELLDALMSNMQMLMQAGITKAEILTGLYSQNKADAISLIEKFENEFGILRKSKIFDFSLWLCSTKKE